jgi:hypothetical protein
MKAAEPVSLLLDITKSFVIIEPAGCISCRTTSAQDLTLMVAGKAMGLWSSSIVLAAAA